MGKSIGKKGLSISLITTIVFSVMCTSNIAKGAEVKDPRFNSINNVNKEENPKKVNDETQIESKESSASKLYATGSTIAGNVLRISTWYYYGANKIYTIYLDNSDYNVNFYHGNIVDAVYALQCSLNTLVDGTKLEVDGSFGTLTHEKLIKFQTQAGLEKDGSCGPATWRKINSLLPGIFEGNYYP